MTGKQGCRLYKKYVFYKNKKYKKQLAGYKKVYYTIVKRKTEREKGEQMEDMEKVTVNRLIEWLKEHGHTSDEIVECIEYITGDKKKEA
ncbi:MAG: hypothetical protein Q4C50_11050 [Eubacteriales bacterium]|nr:hypothetical protein [Eubacteriales bacterium]